MSRSPIPSGLLFGLLSLLMILPACRALADRSLDLEQDAVTEFIATMRDEHGFDPDHVREILAAARVREDVLEAIQRPAEAMPWYRYRPIFVTESRAAGGVRFWRAHRETIEEAARRYGMDPAYIVAIVGVESNYGLITGRYRVLDALATLGFAYPPRASFFRRELEQFLVLAREADLDVLEAKGSYAGAMGSPQFIASSYRAYAADLDEDGRIDLWNSWPDIIGSIARYFSMHGWRPAEPVAFRALVTDTRGLELVTQGLDLDHRLADLAEAGVQSPALDALDPDSPAMLLDLEQEEEIEHWVGLHNFRVITRYNRSQLYAMAVHQLAQDIQERVGDEMVPDGDRRSATDAD